MSATKIRTQRLAVPPQEKGKLRCLLLLRHRLHRIHHNLRRHRRPLSRHPLNPLNQHRHHPLHLPQNQYTCTYRREWVGVKNRHRVGQMTSQSLHGATQQAASRQRAGPENPLVAGQVSHRPTGPG